MCGIASPGRSAVVDSSSLSVNSARRFAESVPPVHAVFVLVGTRDERHFHLCALMAIAQITEEPDFDSRWMVARSVDELRDIVLLGERRRHCRI